MNGKTLLSQLVEKLDVHQVYLSEIGPGRIFTYMRPMLIRFAEMRVALDTETGEQANAIARRLAEIMPTNATYSDDRAIAWLSNLIEDAHFPPLVAKLNRFFYTTTTFNL